jgi:glycerol uptake facilitator-like aquaporin
MIKYFAELVATFFFLSIILISEGSAITIGIALAAAVYFSGKISSAHINPAISVMLFAKGDINTITLIGYVICQILGGLLALLWYKSAYSPKSIK